MLASIASGLVREQSVTSVTQSSEETPTPAIGAAHTTPNNKCDCDAPAQSSNKVTPPDPHPSSIPLTPDTSGSRKPRGRLAGISSLLRESSRTLGASLVEEQKTTDLTARGETYDGPYLNGQRHGDGVVCTFADGSKFLGSYRHDEPSKGTLICQEFTYTGTFAPGGKFHGSRGKLAKSNGSTYEGEFRNNLYHGSGKMTYPDSSVYTGEFREGKRHGVGTLLLGAANHEGDGVEKDVRPSYSGDWRNDLREGEGTEKLPTGDVYQGHFSNNRPHGIGILKDMDGNTKEGIFRYGAACDGPGWTITYANGDKYVGCVVNMKPHGIGTMKYNSGRKGAYNGEFERGKRHGMGLLVYNDGEQFDGLWINDEPNRTKSDKGGVVEIMAKLRQECEAGHDEDEGSDNGDDNDVNTAISALTLEHHQKLAEEYGEIDHIVASKSDNSIGGDSGEAAESEGHFRTFQRRLSRSNLFALEDEIVIEKKEDGRNTNHAHQGPLDEEIGHDHAAVASMEKKLHQFGNGDTFNGFLDARGQRQGHGVYIERKSGTTYEGMYVNNRRHGFGILISPSSKYSGHFVNDEKEGQGTLVLAESVSYSGMFKAGKYHGKGTLCAGDGTVFVGDFFVGQYHGEGTMTYPDGHVYSGQWEFGKRCGFGILKKEGIDGVTLYGGHWADDMRDGKGTSYYVDKLHRSSSDDGAITENGKTSFPRYEGEFQRNQRHGNGRYFFSEGIWIEGPYVNDQPVDGEWTIMENDGSHFEGKATWATACNDDDETYDRELFPVPNGFGKKRFANGDRYKGNFVRGVRHGSGTCTFDDGARWEGTWLNDSFGDGCVGTLRLADGTLTKFGGKNENYSTDYHDGTSSSTRS